MEKAYFPMDVCDISQGYGDKTYSHKKNMALDIRGKDKGIDVAYAPYTGTIKKTYHTDHQVWLESNGKVLCADGIERYLVMMLAHNDELNLTVGQVIKQGEEFYKEGKFSSGSDVTGNHIHLELGEGPFSGSGWFKNAFGIWQINKPQAPEEMLWLKEGTVVKNTISDGIDYMMKWDVVEKEGEDDSSMGTNMVDNNNDNSELENNGGEIDDSKEVPKEKKTFFKFIKDFISFIINLFTKK